MKSRIHYFASKKLPKLAWIATVDRERDSVSVVHGMSVECKDDWMVEGVWDDDFKQGNFHRSEHFFGSGIRIDNSRVYLVPSSALVDRLIYCEDQKKVLVSNSLIVLLAITDAKLDGSHDYHRESLSILKGIEKYEQEFAVNHPRIKCFYQVFYENMVISETGISFEKRSKNNKINSYDQYYYSITAIMDRIKENYKSKGRKIPVSTFSTLSTGYDSTAVTSLAKNLGIETVFTGKAVSPPTNLLIKKRWREDGRMIAQRLGMDVQFLNGKRSSITEDELYFLATNYPKFSKWAWSEISFHSMTSYIEKHCSAAVVFTGHHGDVIWDANVKEKYLNDQITRDNMSGLNLTEIRLKSGFIHVAVPFILGRNIRDIVKISRSREMKPWRLNNSYDRPIPRRIGESSGLDRSLFGAQKKFIAIQYMLPINSQLRKEFSKYLRTKYGISPVIVYIEYLIRLLYPTQPIQAMIRMLKLPLKRETNFLLRRDMDVYYLMSHWALKILSKRVAKILAEEYDNK